MFGMLGMFNSLATNPQLVQNFVGVASAVIRQLPMQSLAPLSQDLANLERGVVDRITHQSEIDAKKLLERIVAVPESSRFHQQLRRFMDAWGVTVSNPESPRPVRPADPFSGGYEIDPEMTEEFGYPYYKGTRYAAVDRHSIVNA